MHHLSVNIACLRGVDDITKVVVVVVVAVAVAVVLVVVAVGFGVIVVVVVGCRLWVVSC